MRKFFLFFMFIFSFTTFADTLLKSATEYDYPPFSVTDKGVADGFSVELLKLVVDELGMKIDFKIDAWDKIKQELKEGKLDVLPLVGYSEERDQYLDFSIPYIVIKANIFVRKGNKSIKTENDLYGKELIVMKGDNVAEYVISKKYSDKIIQTDTYEEAFKLLNSGKYDAVLANSIMGETIISKAKFKEITPVFEEKDSGVSRYKLKLENFEQRFSFAVTEGNSELLNKLNYGLSAVLLSDKYHDLYAKWFNNSNSFLSPKTFIALIIVILIVSLIISLFIVEREVKRKTSIVEKNERRLKEAQAIAKLGNWELDLVNNKLYWSDEVFKIFGVNKNKFEASYEAFLDGIHPDDREKVNKAFNDSINNHTKYEIVHRLLVGDNIKYVREVGQTFYDLEEKPVKSIGTVQDITNEINHQNLLIKAREEAEQSSKVKSEFLSNMSHELRTPLNGIIGFTDLLYETEMSEERKQDLEYIRISSYQLLDIINDILSIAKLESGKQIVKNKTNSLFKLCTNVSNIFKLQADIKGIDFNFFFPDELKETYFLFDELIIIQILNNLLSNAIKFTEKGSVDFNVKLISKDDNSTNIRIDVKDTGVGIDRSNRDSLFDAFFQGEHYLTKKYSGTGLGLSIVKKLVDLISGKITYTSAKEIGTQFSLVLSLKECKKFDAQDQSIIPQDKNLRSKIKVVYAEDAEINYKLVESFLKREGVELDLAEDGEKLLKKLESNSYDIILMDVQMPVLNGIEATKILKASPKYKNIPIIGVSAYAFEENRKKALEAGMNEYIAKPIKREKLIEKINALVN